MKKFLSMILFAAAVAASCNKDLVEIATNEELMTISASIETGVGVKTSLNGDETKSLWSANDELSVFDGVNHRQYTIKDKATYVASEFASFEGTALADADKYYALYPYTSTATLSEVGGWPLISGAVLPAVQAVKKEGTFADGAAVSVARSSNKESFSFQNIAVVIKFTLAEDASSVEFVANNNENIAGTFNVVPMNGDLGEITIQDGKGSSSVKVTGSLKSGKTYYFTVLPQALVKGYTFKINGYAVKTTSSPLVLQRSKVYNISGTLKRTQGTWGIRGSFVNGSWDKETMMYKEGNYQVLKAVDFGASGAFKFYNNSYGWSGYDSAEGKPTEKWMWIKGGSGGDIPAKGVVDIYLENEWSFKIVETGVKP